MKVRIERRALADALAWSAGHLAAKPTIPARAGLLLDADSDTLTISGADWSVTTRSTLDAAVLDPGRIVIPGKLAAQVAASYRSEMVDLVVDGERAELHAGRDRFLLTLLPVHDYPAAPDVPAADGTVDADEFATAVRQVAVATDPTVTAEQWRAAVQLDAAGDRIAVWGTDRYRFADRSAVWEPADGAPGEVGALVPAKALADAVKGLTGRLQLSLSGPTVAVGDNTRRITLTRVDETGRKDPRTFIPEQSPTEAVIPVEPLIAAVKRACLVATDRKPKVLLGFGADDISVRATGADTGATALDIVEGQHLHGEPLQIAFMSGLLLDGLQSAGIDHVRIGVSAPHRPALMQPHGDDAGDWRHLVMPVQLT